MQPHSTCRYLCLWPWRQEARHSLGEDSARGLLLSLCPGPGVGASGLGLWAMWLDRAGEQWEERSHLWSQRAPLSQLAAAAWSMGTVSLGGLLPGVCEQWMGFRMSPRALGMPVCRVIFWCNSRCSQNWDSIPQVAGSWKRGVFIVPVPLSLRAPKSDSSFPSTPPTSSS